jgi:hypothetical protein
VRLPTGRVPESDDPPARRGAGGRGRRRPARAPGLERLEARALLAGHDFADATPVALDRFDSGGLSGSIDAPGQVDVYRFIPAVDSPVEIGLDAAGGSNLDSVLELIDGGTGATLASDDNGGGGLNSLLLRDDVRAGHTYYVRAAGAGGTTGPYRLTFEGARDVAPDDTDSASVSGEVASNRDVESYRFVAAASGVLAIRMNRAPGVALDTFLRVLDGGGSPIFGSEHGQRFPLVNDDSRGTTDSTLYLSVTAGQTYYVQAGSSGGSRGPYTLTFEGAQPIAPQAGGPTPIAGAILTPADLTLYRFAAPLDGVLSARLDPGPGGVPAGQLTTFTLDDAGEPVPHDADPGGAVDLDVVAGRTYYLQVGSSLGAGAGPYVLTLTPPAVPDPPADFAHALPIATAPSGPASQVARIAAAGDVSAFRFVAARSGGLTIRQAAVPGGALDSLLTVYEARDDGTIAPIGSDDDSRGTRDSLVRIVAAAGRTYYARAAGFGGSTGVYALTITPDDFGDDLASAQPLAFPAAGPLVQAGTIDAPRDVDVFAFVAPADGGVTLRQQAAFGSGLDSLTTVFDAAGRPLAFDDDGGDPAHPLDSLVRFDVQAGRRYYVRAGAAPNVSGLGGFGDYTLRLDPGPPTPPDDYGNTFDDAHPVDLSADFARLSGTIDSPADADVFRVVAPADGSLRVRQDPTAGSPLQASLAAFDDTGRLVASDATSSDVLVRTGSALQFAVAAGHVYFVRAAAFRGRVGGYDLSLFAGPLVPPAADDFGDDLATARALATGPDGSGSLAGTIDAPGDADAFRFVAPLTGLIDAREDAAPGSRLDPFLYAFDDSGSPLAQDDDIDATADRNSRLSLGRDDYPVVAGKTYYLKAAGFGASTGAYRITILPVRDLDHPGRVFDDFRDTLPAGPDDPVATIPLSAGHGAQAASIDAIGDQDVFRVVAPADGVLTIRQRAAPGSGLDSLLSVFDGDRALLAGDNDSEGTRDSLVRFDAIGGQAYYIRAGAFGGFNDSGPNVGRYVITVDESAPSAAAGVGHSFADATPIAPPATGVLALPGQVLGPGVADFYRFVAPATGVLTARMAAPPGGLDSVLTIFDGARGLLATDDDGGGALDSLIRLDVQEGQAFFLRAAGFGTSVGGYLLTLAVGPPSAAAVPGDAFADAPAVGLVGANFGSQAGSVDAPGAAQVFRFVAAQSGPLSIRQVASGGALAGALAVFDAARGAIAHGAAVGDGSGDVAARLDVVAGRTYFVRAGGAGASVGGYVLLFNDDAADSFDAARPIAVDPKELTATAFGRIDFAGVAALPADADMFRFAAPLTGPIEVRLEWSAGSELDGALFVFDDQRRLIGADDDGPLQDAAVRVNVVAGRTYYLRAAASGSRPGPTRRATGAYRLTLAPLDDDDGDTFDDARALPPAGLGPMAVAGAIEVAGDVDMFQFVAAATGRLSIRLAADAGSALDAALVAFDGATRSEVARGDDFDGGTDGAVQLNVTAGRLYFVRAAGFGTSAGRYHLAIGAAVADDFGSDFASAAPLALSGSGSGAQSGTIEDPDDVDVFRFVAPLDGQVTVVLAPQPGGVLATTLRAYTTLDGAPTLVADDHLQPGSLQLDVSRGQVYFLRVAPGDRSAGGYRLSLQAAAADQATPDIRRAGKATFDQLRDSFVRDVPRLGPSPAAAVAIDVDLVRTFLATLGAPPTTDYLLLWVDPVDFRTADLRRRVSGYTAGQGPILEQQGGYYSGSGVLQLLILPRAVAGRYSVELVGDGGGPVLFGAARIDVDASVSEAKVTFPDNPDLARPVDLALKESLAAVLDFAPPTPSGRPGPPDEPAGSPGPRGPGPEGPARSATAGNDPPEPRASEPAAPASAPTTGVESPMPAIVSAPAPAVATAGATNGSPPAQGGLQGASFPIASRLATNPPRRRPGRLRAPRGWLAGFGAGAMAGRIASLRDAIGRLDRDQLVSGLLRAYRPGLPMPAVAVRLFRSLLAPGDDRPARGGAGRSARAPAGGAGKSASAGPAAVAVLVAGIGRALGRVRGRTGPPLDCGAGRSPGREEDGDGEC